MSDTAGTLVAHYIAIEAFATTPALLPHPLSFSLTAAAAVCQAGQRSIALESHVVVFRAALRWRDALAAAGDLASRAGCTAEERAGQSRLRGNWCSRC